MKLYLLKKISILWVVLFLVSCGFQNNPQDEAAMPPVIDTPTYTLVDNTTATVLPSIMQGEFKTMNDAWVLKEECINIDEISLGHADNFAGNLIVNGNNTAYIINMSSLEIDQLPQVGHASSSFNSGDFKPSPDNTMVAYIENYVGEDGKSIAERKLRVLDNNLSFQQLATWSVTWQWPISWLNNQEISLLLPNETNIIYILNVINGEIKQKDISYILKNSNYVSSSWYIFGSPIVYFDSSATKSIFPVGENEIVLWDTEHQKYLWHGENIDYIENGNATWSVDGGLAVIVAADQTQEEIVILNLVDMTVEKVPLMKYVNIEKFSLSPNGKILGVWASDDKYDFAQQKLILIDLSNKKITDTCIENSIFTHQPIWFDDDTLSVSAIDHGENKVLLININDLIANTIIADNVEPVAWLKK